MFPPIMKKRKKYKSEPKTPTKTPTRTKKASTKKSSTKKKTKDVRYLTDYITNESLDSASSCPDRVSSIVNIRKISITDVVTFPQQAQKKFSKTILLNTEPQKERKGYTECDTNERGCSEINLDLHTATRVGTECSAAMLNIGAPIWALDWVSRPSAEEEQLVAIAPHTLHSSFHKTGKPTMKGELFDASHSNVKVPTISDVEHCGKIQIWNFGKLSDKQLNRDPYVQFYIEHDHGFIWDLKWMPNSYVKNERLGILACACSDGTVIILNVPHYSQILSEYESKNNIKLGKDERLVISLKPEVYSQLQHDSENNASLKVPYTISWSPSLKYFVSGYHDGTISLWKVLNNTEGNILEHAVSVFGHSHPTNDLSIRSISWFDPTMNEYIFATCSNDGFFKIWDVRDIFYPYYASLSGNRFWMTGVAFPEKSNALLIVSHDGTIRQFDAVENAFQLFSTCDGPIWDISISSTRSSILVATATGRIEVLSLEQDSMGKKRRAVDNRVDDLLLQVELVTNDNDYSETDPEMTYKLSNKADVCYSLPYHFKDADNPGEKFTRLPFRFKNEKLTPDIRLAMHRCLYHPSKHEDLKNWCLLSGYDGVVFLLNVPETYTSQ
ncbi:WD40 domain-containing protein [Naegleria gruberi]|uniref:WD40 domain-containing protein n=1 Tax=Naegleria gruberi TaxID=5762 RepID=D2V766_NAEGR|nr:WD40 domain-containing protein [Naegleria gruberi]EFC47319.1 WD40 domain-containing protein [Naegleria gruberi]|eukprot:XP_002680063.1 WD40 domain-containing protein [Naegleria gruberi strain NEG-M]